jgi:nucleoid-associated protein YgaU/TPR repeat protein
MKHSQNLRLVLVRSLFGSALLASSALALTPAELDSLRTKADRGNAIAQYNLGLAYSDRRESIYDPAQAYAWLSIAAENGTNGNALATLTSLLTPEQLAEGKRLLASLTVSPVSATPSPVIAAEPAPVITMAPPTEPAPAVAAEADQDQKKLSSELAAAWRENDLLKTALTAKLADANKRIAIAEAALASKDKEIAALQARLAESPAAAAPSAQIGISAELASLRSERDQLQATVAATSVELAALRASAAKAPSDQAALREKLADAAEAMTNAKRAQNLAEAEASSLKAAADRASAERLAVAAQLESVTAELEKAKAAPAPAPVVARAAPTPPLISETGLKTLTAERDRLATTVKSLEKERDALTAKLNSAGSAASAKLTSVMKELDETKQTLAAKEKESAELSTQLAVAKAALPVAPAADVVVAPIPTVPTPPTAESAESADRIAELEKAKSEADTKLEAALRSFTLQQAEIDRLQKSLASIDAERSANADKLEAANTELAALRPQAASAATVSTEAETLRAQLAAANQTVSEQSAALSTANASLTDARKTVDNATAELVATRDQLRLTQSQAAASAIEAQQLKTRLALAGNLPAATGPSRPGSVPSFAITLPAATVAPVAEPVAPKVEAPAEPRTHTVVAGDSLSRIAKQYYGSASRWTEILEANRSVISNPNALTVGTKLRIP